jgi:uncharacterized protein
MIHPYTELRFIRPAIGWGVVATRPIPRGTITWALDRLDHFYAAEEIAAMPAYAQRQLQTYSYVDRHGRHVLCWDHARFVNHSCDANCLSVGYDFEIAVRDIAAGEELTDDYRTFNSSEAFPCCCLSGRCRGYVLPDDKLRLAKHWNELARDAFFLINDVPQALWEVVTEKKEIAAALADPNRLRPIQTHFDMPIAAPAVIVSLDQHSQQDAASDGSNNGFPGKPRLTPNHFDHGVRMGTDT